MINNRKLAKFKCLEIKILILIVFELWLIRKSPNQETFEYRKITILTFSPCSKQAFPVALTTDEICIHIISTYTYIHM